MFVAGGQPGMAKDLQVKVAAARKVFRIMKVRNMHGPWCDCASMSALAAVVSISRLSESPSVP